MVFLLQGVIYIWPTFSTNLTNFLVQLFSIFRKCIHILYYADRVALYSAPFPGQPGHIPREGRNVDI